MNFQLKALLTLVTFVFVCISLSSCTGHAEIEHVNTIELQFLNQSDHKVSFNLRLGNNNVRMIAIAPDATSSVFSYEAEGPKNLDPEICCDAFLQNQFVEGDGVQLIINDTLCFFEQEGIYQISNYSYDTSEPSVLSYTYTFSEEEISKMNPGECQ